MSEKLVAIGFEVLKSAQKEYLSGDAADRYEALRNILVDGQLQNEIGEAALPMETVEIEDLPRGKVFIGIRSATRAHTHAWAARGEYEMPEGREETARVFEDEETDILAAVYERLRRLDPSAQDRILSYMRDRLAWDNRSFALKKD